MSEKALSYTFKIDNITPVEMPFDRLLEYYAQLRKLIGAEEGVHLVGVVESSHATQFVVDTRFETAVAKRIMAVNEGTAPKTAIAAQIKINEMLSEDATSGAFFEPSGRNVINFPGRRAEDENPIRFRDAATFTGELYSIAAVQGDVKIRLATDDQGTVICTTTKEIAKELSPYLFEKVRVKGRGLWTKADDGRWLIDDLHITEFAHLSGGSLRETVNNIRELKIGWPDDPLTEIDRLSNGDSLQ